MPQKQKSDHKAEILSRSNLILAWEDVRSKKSAPGIDDISVSRWGRNWEANIERLVEQVEHGTYHPRKPRRIQVIEKGGKTREISLLTVSDKVLQKSFQYTIEPEFESRFLGCSHAYRPNRSTATAVQQLLNYRDQGLVWVLDADLVDCFNRIDHDILLALFQRVIKENFVIDLLKKWLLAGRKFKKQALGIPQGAVISPLMCNIYLHQLDAKMTCAKWHYIRYADDFIVFAKTQAQIEQALDLAQSKLQDLKLEFHPIKTRISSFEEGFTFLGVDFKDNNYRYLWRDKRVVTRGRDLRALYRYVPDFYSKEE